MIEMDVDIANEPPPEEDANFIQPGEGGVIVNPAPIDVVNGRGGKINSHYGNKRFRDIIGKHKKMYLETKQKKNKVKIAYRVVKEIRQGDPPVRFLAKNPGSDTWSDIGDDKAIKKVCQALREDGPRIRKEKEKEEEEEGKLKGQAIPTPDKTPFLSPSVYASIPSPSLDYRNSMCSEATLPISNTFTQNQQPQSTYSTQRMQSPAPEETLHSSPYAFGSSTAKQSPVPIFGSSSTNNSSNTDRASLTFSKLSEMNEGSSTFHESSSGVASRSTPSPDPRESLKHDKLGLRSNWHNRMKQVSCIKRKKHQMLSARLMKEESCSLFTTEKSHSQSSLDERDSWSALSIDTPTNIDEQESARSGFSIEKLPTPTITEEEDSHEKHEMSLGDITPLNFKDEMGSLSNISIPENLVELLSRSISSKLNYGMSPPPSMRMAGKRNSGKSTRSFRSNSFDITSLKAEDFVSLSEESLMSILAADASFGHSKKINRNSGKSSNSSESTSMEQIIANYVASLNSAFSDISMGDVTNDKRDD